MLGGGITGPSAADQMLLAGTGELEEQAGRLETLLISGQVDRRRHIVRVKVSVGSERHISGRVLSLLPSTPQPRSPQRTFHYRITSGDQGVMVPT